MNKIKNISKVLTIVTLFVTLHTGTVHAAKIGFGGNIGIKVLYPEEINNYIDEIYSNMLSGTTLMSQTGDQSILIGYPLKLKLVIKLKDVITIEPYANLFLTGKFLLISGDVSRNTNIGLFDIGGGTNLWIHLGKKMIRPKFGAAFWGGHTILKTSGYSGDSKFSGNGIGGSLLGGMDINFKKISVNIEFGITYAETKLDQDKLELNFVPSSTPNEFNQIGFEFRPGVTYYF